jgi:hypothetical protein
VQIQINEIVNVLIKKPIVPFNHNCFEQNEPEQRILIGIICLNGKNLVAEGSLNQYLDRIQWEIVDWGTITINSEGIIIYADFILDELELEKLKLWSMTSYNYLLKGKTADN